MPALPYFAPRQAGPLWQSKDCDVGLKSRLGSDMRQDNPFQRSQSRRPSAGQPSLVLWLAVGSLAVLTMTVMLVPSELVLPAVSVAATVVAAATAVTAYASPRLAALRPVNGWDIAGALTLIGCAAAILGEIEPLVEFLKPAPERSPSRG